MRRPARWLLAAATIAAACRSPSATPVPVFVAGRPVATIGDSLFAVPASDRPVILVRDRRGNLVDTIGAGVLRDPTAVQAMVDTWYVGDRGDTGFAVQLFTADGRPVRRVALDTAVSEQFAPLPDGRIVVEASGARLLAVGRDSVTTFALVLTGTRPSLLAAADGGVVHAVPDKTITFYNGFGHIRWRVDWPWVSTAFVSGIAVDAQSRVHLISGVGNTGTFIVYTLARASGEIVRWSVAESTATFVVNQLGAIAKGDTLRWRR